MRRFLVCSGVDGRPKSLEWLRQAVEKRSPDGILFAGGVLDGARLYSRDPAALTHEEGRFVEHFFETLGNLGVFSAVIPGPADGPLEEFLRIGMHAEVESPAVHLAHATLLERGELAVSGVGGKIGQEVSVIMAQYHLRSLWTAKQPHRILLLATPPTGALGGPEGSSVVGDFIDSYHPALCVVGGPSQCRGSQRVAKTLVINPGRLAEGWAAWFDWNRQADDAVEMLNLRELSPKSVALDIGGGD